MRSRRSSANSILALIGLFICVSIPPPDASATNRETTLVYPTFKHDLGMHHVTSFHLRLFTGNRHHFNRPRGLAAVKLVERDRPDKTGDDDELTVYGLNAGEHCIIYNRTPTTIGSYGRKGKGEGEFLDPWGIAANPAGDVYVADTGNDRVVRLRDRGGSMRVVETLYTAKGDSVPFRSPKGVALTSGGDLFVADTGNNRLVRVDRSGRLAGLVGGEGFFSRPEAIALIDKDERWSCRPAEWIIVIDDDGRRIRKIRFNGEPLRTVTVAELGLAGARVRGVAIDYYHQVYLTDETGHQIHKLDRDLRLLTSFGREGKGDAEFRSPFGIACWRRFGQFFISEESGAQYYWTGTDIVDYHTDPVRFRPDGRILFTLTERSKVSIRLEDREGTIVRTLAEERFYPAGKRAISFDGKDDGGTILPPGPYRVRIEARPTYSSMKHFQKRVAFPLTLG